MITYGNLEEYSRYGISLLNDRVVRKQSHLGSKTYFDCMRAICWHFIKQPDPMVVPVYNFEVLEVPIEQIYGVYKYRYDMKRLGVLSHEERKTIDQIQGVKFYTRNNFSLRKSRNTGVIEAQRSFPRLFDFLDKIYEQNRYWDSHSGNIMKDEDGSYKLIDLESFVLPPLEDPKNNWISR